MVEPIAHVAKSCFAGARGTDARRPTRLNTIHAYVSCRPITPSTRRATRHRVAVTAAAPALFVRHLRVTMPQLVYLRMYFFFSKIDSPHVLYYDTITPLVFFLHFNFSVSLLAFEVTHIPIFSYKFFTNPPHPLPSLSVCVSYTRFNGFVRLIT